MIAEKLRQPLTLQIAAVIALFVAAIGVLWFTSSSIVGREERRSNANDRLKQAAELLESRCKEALAQVHPYPEYMEPNEWEVIDRSLTDAAARIHERFPDVEGGYYVPDRRDQPFLPPLALSGLPPFSTTDAPRPPSQEGRNLYDHVETQADAAFRKKYGLLVVEEIGPETVAIQAVPIWSGGQTIASAWTMTRLVDPIFLDRPSAGYQLFAGLALAGLALSMILTFNLVRTIRRQAAERTRLQLELRRNERLAALGRLLAGVAHEVRNPLAGIRSTAQLWQRGLGHGEESLEGLVQEVDRLETIVSSLLQFSRAEAQELAPGDLNTVVAEAARLALGAASAQGVRVETSLDDDQPQVVLSPPALLQVFRNLTTNALQTMPGGGELRLSTKLAPDRKTVFASVTDAGCGLSSEVLGHLFEPFFTTKSEGTGLGLAIAREIALAHRGDLSASNRTDGPGAIFTLTLPVSSNSKMETP